MGSKTFLINKIWEVREKKKNPKQTLPENFEEFI